MTDFSQMQRQRHITEAAQELGVTAHHLRMLERKGKIPPARRDLNSRVYSPFEIALLRNIGVGSRPRRLKHAEEVLEAAR
jgi:DNA-binding transcriptional MerR regulator